MAVGGGGAWRLGRQGGSSGAVRGEVGSRTGPFIGAGRSVRGKIFCAHRCSGEVEAADRNPGRRGWDSSRRAMGRLGRRWDGAEVVEGKISPVGRRRFGGEGVRGGLP
jgi:hypothetical protein